MFRWDPAEGHLSHLNNRNGYHSTNEDKTVLEELHNCGSIIPTTLEKCTKEMNIMMFPISYSNPKFKVAQSVMVRNHVDYSSQPKWWQGEKKLTLMMLTCSTSKLFENTRDSFLASIKNNCQNYTYNLRPRLYLWMKQCPSHVLSIYSRSLRWVS